jgi:hypothetical protein
LIIEALQRLRFGGLPLHEYTYVGLGSVYYADFILFHKYLYMDRMICAEASDIPRRMRFNKPYSFVRLDMKPVGSVIPSLQRERRHFVWLDYDYGINEDVVQDVTAAANALAPDSLLLVTVDVEPRHQADRDLSEKERTELLLRKFPETFGRYLGRSINRRDFTANSFPLLVAEILRTLLRQESARRAGFQFYQLFNFAYADGAQMLSLGGVIGTKATAERIKRSGVRQLPFITQGGPPVFISVPPLTPREKDWLDQNLGKQIRVKNLRFELQARVLRNYRRYRRHYPSYYEALL